MADEGIKRIRIDQRNLPPLDAETNSYYVRYRIVSQDKNRNSAWSQIETIPWPFTFLPSDVPITVNKDVANSRVEVVWNPAEIINNEGAVVGTTNDYDIVYSWSGTNSGTSQFGERAFIVSQQRANSVNLLIPSEVPDMPTGSNIPVETFKIAVFASTNFFLNKDEGINPELDSATDEYNPSFPDTAASNNLDFLFYETSLDLTA